VSPAAGSELLKLSLVEVAALLRRGEVTSVELLDAALARADAVDAILGAYICRTDNSALAAAVRADADFAAGVDRGPLQGIPVAVKDNLCTADAPTTAQSVVHDPAWDGAGDATVIARLRAGGAVLTGKLTLSEFAIGPPGPSSPFPRPRNPWDLRCWPGGSSSGTATAVAAGLVFAGLGTDTAGSIRIPSAMCGLTGLKPSFARVPVSGSIGLAPSLDHIGPMARAVDDCAAVLQVIAGHDAADPTSSRADVPDFAHALRRSPHGFRVGVAMPFDDGLDAGVADAFDDAVAALRATGAQMRPVVLPDFAPTAAAAKVILEAESFALHEPMLRERWADYSPATRRRLATGAFAGAAELLRAYERRAATSHRLRQLFAEVDLVVAPAMPMPAPVLAADGTLDRSTVSRSTGSMRYWNCTGHPALVVPMGCSVAGLPFSLQIVGGHLREADVLALGSAFQAVTDWHRAVPEVGAVREADPWPTGDRAPCPPSADPADVDAAALAAAELARRGIDVGEDRDELGRAYALHRSDVATIGVPNGHGILAPAAWAVAP
jgi:aspartyl-tRNA(Asn)/glutamyl-tRNA(Gln) amidotransferase subunit A